MSTELITSVHNSPLDDDIERVLVDEVTLQNRIRELGQMIEEEYRGKGPAADLRSQGQHHLHGRSHPLHPHSPRDRFHGDQQLRHGRAQHRRGSHPQGPQQPDRGRNVVVVEDIIDSGHTLSYLAAHPARASAGQPAHRGPAGQARTPRGGHRGRLDWFLDIPNDFVVGYGLDYNEVYRNLPYIGILKPSIYTQPPAD